MLVAIATRTATEQGAESAAAAIATLIVIEPGLIGLVGSATLRIVFG